MKSLGCNHSVNLSANLARVPMQFWEWIQPRPWFIRLRHFKIMLVGGTRKSAPEPRMRTRQIQIQRGRGTCAPWRHWTTSESTRVYRSMPRTTSPSPFCIRMASAWNVRLSWCTAINPAIRTTPETSSFAKLGIHKGRGSSSHRCPSPCSPHAEEICLMKW